MSVFLPARHRMTRAGLLTVDVVALMAVGTRSIQISLIPSAVHQGAECDAYFDNVSLKLGKE